MNTHSFKHQLLALRAETQAALVSGADATKAVELDQTAQGRVSRIDAMQQQQMALAAERRRHERLKQINAALARIDNDEFGICAICGEDIPEKRLQLDPTIQTCVACRQ